MPSNTRLLVMASNSKRVLFGRLYSRTNGLPDAEESPVAQQPPARAAQLPLSAL